VLENCSLGAIASIWCQHAAQVSAAGGSEKRGCPSRILFFDLPKQAKKYQTFNFSSRRCYESRFYDAVAGGAMLHNQKSDLV